MVVVVVVVVVVVAVVVFIRTASSRAQAILRQHGTVSNFTGSKGRKHEKGRAAAPKPRVVEQCPRPS